MIIGRNSELNQLETYYERDNSQIIVVYGQKYIGKTSLIRDFIQDKPSYYYLAEACSEREQKYRLGSYLAELGIKSLKFPEFEQVFECFSLKHTQKKVIVFDEFQNIIKNCPDFLGKLTSFIHSKWNNQQYLVILMSSSVGFVENSMVEKIGDAAFELSGFIKLKELSFDDLREHFCLYTNDDCATVYSILGGVPGLWEMFDIKLSVQENIIRSILSPSGNLRYVAQGFVNDELRETNVYNTILGSIALGKHKLNDLYEHTGFSRAKISVYLKNLSELELVGKVFSVDTEGHDNSQKGLYDITNNFVDFFYTFIFGKGSLLESLSKEEFYKFHIAPGLKQYTGKYYKKICLEYIQKQNSKNKLPFKAEHFGEWIGKQGNIDIVATDDNGKTLLALCVLDKPMVTYDDYEWMMFVAKKACLYADYIYLFAGTRFDEKLSLEGKIRSNLKLFLLDNI